MLGALAEGTSVVRGLSTGDDVARTRAAVEALGRGRRGRPGDGRPQPCCTSPTASSTSATRAPPSGCWPACAPAFDWLTVLSGDESIARRPMDRVAGPLRLMGAGVDGRDGGSLPPLVVRGGDLHGIDYAMPVASAQVKSAILLAGLGAEGETVVREKVPHPGPHRGDAGGGRRRPHPGGRGPHRPPAARRPPPVRARRARATRPRPRSGWWPRAWSRAATLVVEDVYLGPARVRLPRRAAPAWAPTSSG